jgi:hypothetical protein
LLPPQQASVLFQHTALVNRPVELRDRHFAVNPGIPAALAAAALGKPLRAFDVKPRVLAGTANVPGAMQIRAEDLRGPGAQSGRPGARIGTQIAPTGTLFSPNAGRSMQPPRPLTREEPGRLGDSPPRAARGAVPTTEGRAPPQPSREPRPPTAQPPSGQREGAVAPGNRPEAAPPGQRRGANEQTGGRRAAPSPAAGATPPAAVTHEPLTSRPGREPPGARRGIAQQRNVEQPRIGAREAAPQRSEPRPEQRTDRAPIERAPAAAAPQRPPASAVPQRQAAPRPSAPATAPRPAAPPAAAARPPGPSTTGAAPGGGGRGQRRE